MSPKLWLLCGALLGGSAVALGAYRAHRLETRLKAEAADDAAKKGAIEKRLTDCETALRYQMFQALALLIVGVLAERRSSKCLSAAAICFFLGTLLFCGPLYLVSLFDVHLHWAVIPSGGALLIAGWVVFCISCVLRPTAN